ncbi:MAG TPA: ribbon-helix-helix domain-containing protein [Vicinamibacteria bacterium]|nr:ribbon-helix-helix domain-containing protein [Vicinamibacteria bacterium]
MNTEKVAITIPKDLLEMVDALSSEKGISRSKFISSLIREKLLQQRNSHLKEVYDRVFSDEAIRKEQLETARWFEAGESCEGQEW